MRSQSRFWILLVLSVLIVAGCSKDEDAGSGVSANIPLIKPPVNKATPSGLAQAGATSLGVSQLIQPLSLNTNEITNRFYTNGPTKIDNLLSIVDSRLNEINTRSAETQRDCLNATPVEQTISIAGTGQTVYFQCYDLFGDGTGGMVFGKKDNTWYIYQNVGAGRSLATVTPIADSAGDYTVDAWFSVGQNNASGCSSTWYGCSYGLIHLKANSATKHLELTVAGTGFGYCGAHLNTDGTNLFIKGSPSGGTSDGSSWTCPAADTACTLATDLAQAGTCTAIDHTTFELSSLGVTGQSPFGTGVTLDGTASDAVHFGYDASAMSAISGVGAF